MDDELGHAWLQRRYGIRAVQPVTVSSRIGTTRTAQVVDGFTSLTFPGSFRPPSDLRGHLTFAFKYEGIHLEFLARLFRALDPTEMIAWLQDEPTGAYARALAFSSNGSPAKRSISPASEATTSMFSIRPVISRQRAP